MKIALLLVTVVLCSCAELPDLGVCGNGIVEASLGEACDGSKGCTVTCEVACDEMDMCEDGQTCGVDKVCRAPSGMFTLAEPPQLFDVLSMRAGDFDDDEIVDLAGVSATQIAVLYGSATAPLATGFPPQDVPSSTSPPVIYERDPASVEGSTLAIAVPTDGIAVLVADGETFQPKIDGAFVVDAIDKGIAVVTDPDPLQGDVVLEFTNRPQLGPVRVRRLAFGAIAGQDLGDCSTPATPVRVIQANVTRDGHSLLLAVRIGDPTRWGVCEYRGLGAPTKTTVNSPFPTSVVLANVDADDCEEIVVARHVGADTIVEFVDATGDPCTLATSTTAFVDGTFVGTDTEILAAGPVVSQQRDAIVLAHGVYAVTAANELVPVTPPTMATRWGVAAVVDLNRDGFGDVVGSLVGQQNLEVVRGGPAAGLIWLNSYEVGTDVEVVAMRRGDFDGDGYGDVAVVESLASNNQRISILYGRADGVVAAPRPNSRYQGLVRFEVLRNFGWGNTRRGRDGIDDLFVARTLEDTPTVGEFETRVGVLVGDASRVLTMPRFPDSQRATVGTLAVGRIVGDTVSAVAVRATSLTSSELVTFDLESTFTTAPLDGFVVDETQPGAVLRTNASSLIVVASDTGPRVFDSAGVQCTGMPDIETLGFHAIDVDGDGFDEIAISNGALRVRVYDVIGGVPCSIGEELLVDALASCRDVARVGTTTVAACARTEFGAAVFRIVDGVREPTPFAELAGAPRRITPGDYDGDGVTDLAISINRNGVWSVQFVRQCPAHDTRDCR